MAEALSARGEAREKAGEFALAGEDYAAAVGHAEGLGAQAQVGLLRARLAVTMFETGQGEQGERIIREVLAEGWDSGADVAPAAQLFLAVWLGRTGRRDEAREQLDLLLERFNNKTLAIFEGLVRGIVAWLDCADGRYADALRECRLALESALSPLSRMVAPEMVPIHLVTAAWALAGAAGQAGQANADDATGEAGPGRTPDSGRPVGPGPVPDRARDAARLIGAYDGLLPGGHFRAHTEREILANAREAAVAVLGDAAFEAAYADGGDLTMEEAAALV